jgi:hypothetical protein
MKSTEAYHMTMDAVRHDPRVRTELGDDIEDGFWVSGAVQFDGGDGVATYSIPIHGDKASGRAISHAFKRDGKWSVRLLYVTAEGKAPIVLVNEDNTQVPGAPTGV